LERLRVSGKLSSIPVIVLSGRDRVGNWDRVLKAGARTFLQKPVANERLLAVIRLVLAEQDRPRAMVYDLAAPDAGLGPQD
jgi:FixJ family two-component response regulator